MSEIILDTITGKSTATTITIGSTPVVSSSANSMTIRGEGSNQTSIQQGLAKAWIAHSAYSTPAATDSFNHASLTDVGTGNFRYNFTNNFRAAQAYTNNGGMAHEDDHLGTFAKVINPINTADILTSSVEVSATYVSAAANGAYDYNHNYHSCLGDLA